MLEKFINKSQFTSTEDFAKNYHVNIPDNFNFGYDVVDEWARINPAKRAICWVNDQGEHIDFTFADIKEQSDRAASFFQSLGIGKGDMVMLVLKRRYEFWFAVIGLHKIGAIAIPATHLLTKKDIVYRNNAADIKAIVSVNDEIVIQHVNDAMAESPSVKYRIMCGDVTPEGWLNFDQGIKDANPFTRPQHVNNNNDISLLYFTSGTTGEPKMVIHNFAYPLGHIVTAKYWHNLNEDSLHLTVADTGWAKAVWGKLYGQWIAGAAVMVYDHEKFTPHAMLQVIQDYHVTSFCAPPTVFRFMIREDLSQFDLSSLKYATTAGEALNPSVFNAFYEATGIKMMEAFGQTETTPTIITFPWMEPKPGSMGVPNPAYDMDLIAADGRSVEDGEVGEVVIKTDRWMPLGLFMGYYRDEALTKQVYHDNVYHTGDMAWRDESGYYWFVGRSDDVIKSSGYRIGPFEVESALMTHPAVVECAVTGVPDEIRGQVVKATIVLAASYKNRADDHLKHEIQNHVKQVTAPYKYPRIIEFVDELPKTISGKIKRAEIRKQG
ncbi:acetyl-CoA synthetase [Dysgonomonas sp. PFB1-18]|uniref:AMP-binding protein n=1 Tax=unclassified Dysgonomonas TaxID=2630389 RepID=UPI0024739E6E|nr:MULTISPECIES: AMP-binding protein [unclassified Dysgonomonas]MDL2302849.1 AMP-binding protein [Dysgonomonas sp. OttesenSCG-928-D17]MDH6309629.1 acetyl-CoA synthetase [Dysgonomonas sp. PF1-14]MDH6339043.1 acetyl-CoA synthetase [Dysgonomonas sp. PF1-16]MDH6380671.1 acetyl-CoA synthetase [Dysgonomonas sp. PFB1-18]MDH6398167.1 acetyl-CoA synthetase [Dysgonomonas sp. PF1-23]